MLLTLGTYFASVSLACGTPSAGGGDSHNQEKAPEKTQATALEPSIFGEPIVVYGVQITDDQIKRALCFGTGRVSVQYSPVDMLKFNVLAEDELKRRKEAGEDLSKFAISDEFNMNKLLRDKADFVMRYPTLDFPTEVGRSFMSLDLFLEHQKIMLQFDRLFIADNPDDWPDLTEAVVMEFGGELFVQDARDSHKNRKIRMLHDRLKKAELALRTGTGDEFLDAETDARLLQQATEQAETYTVTPKDLEELQPDDPIFTDTLRQIVLQALNNYAVIHADPDQILADLPEAGADSPSDPQARQKAREERARAVLLTVDGVPIMIDEVWQRIAPFCTSDLIEDVKRFLVLNALLERDLTAKDSLMSFAEFREYWPTTARINPNTGERPKMNYQEYLNNHEMVSSQVLGLPSLYHFARLMRLQESYRKSIKDELAKDENLLPLMPQMNQIAGAAKANVEVLLCSAYDFVNVKWKDNGWAAAKAKALDLKKQLDEGAQWTPLLELHSEFWDPPMPDTGSKPQFGYLFKGKFGEQTRSQLLQYMSESEYRLYLYGAPLIADYIFFDQKMGTVDGPFRGPKGYYITRLTGKTPFSRPLDIKEPVHREILEINYLKNKMNGRAQELLAKGVAEGQIKGVALGGGIRDL